MNTIPSGIGTRIRDARKAAGMSQTVLGQHLNKTLRTIQKYESGEIEPFRGFFNRNSQGGYSAPIEAVSVPVFK